MNQIPDEGDDRLAAWRFRSVCGIEALDRLAAADPDELGTFLRDVAANGWIIKATTKLPARTPAYFFPRKGRFYYDPERMTRLDVIHERVHLAAFIARGSRGLGPRQILAIDDEIAAYSSELNAIQQAGRAATSYLHYLEGRIGYYQGLREQVRRGRRESPHLNGPED